MGLGPSICNVCLVFSDYIPDENPKRQGQWICPVNEYHQLTYLFRSMDLYEEIILNTAWIEELGYYKKEI